MKSIHRHGCVGIENGTSDNRRRDAKVCGFGRRSNADCSARAGHVHQNWRGESTGQAALKTSRDTKRERSGRLLKDGKLQMLLKPDTYIKLEPAFEDAFFDEEMTFCQVIRNNKRKITGFRISLSRVRNLLFTKVN